MQYIKRFMALLMAVVLLVLVGWVTTVLADADDTATLGGQDSSGEYLWRVNDGNFIPGTDDQNSIGDSTHEVDNIYIDGTAYIDDIDAEDAVFSGDILFRTTIYASGYHSGVTTIASEVSPLGAAHIAFAYIRINDGSQAPRELPDGTPGKTIKIEFIGTNPAWIFADDTYLGITKTSWSKIIFDTQYDYIILHWIDDTNGWMIIHNDGCLVTR